MTAGRGSDQAVRHIHQRGFLSIDQGHGAEREQHKQEHFNLSHMQESREQIWGTESLVAFVSRIIYIRQQPLWLKTVNMH